MNNSTMTTAKASYYRVMFYSAAWFNWIAGITWMVSFEETYKFMGGGSLPQQPIFNLILQTLSMLIILFGGVYFWIARNLDSPASRGHAIVASVGKFFLAMLFYVYAAQGTIPPALAGLTSIDLLYSILFMEYLLCQKKSLNKLNLI